MYTDRHRDSWGNTAWASTPQTVFLAASEGKSFDFPGYVLHHWRDTNNAGTLSIENLCPADILRNLPGPLVELSKLSPELTQRGGKFVTSIMPVRLIKRSGKRRPAVGRIATPAQYIVGYVIFGNNRRRPPNSRTINYLSLTSLLLNHQFKASLESENSFLKRREREIVAILRTSGSSSVNALATT